MSSIHDMASARRKRDEVTSLLNKKGIYDSVGIIELELEYGLKISFRERIPTSATKILSKLSKEVHLQFDKTKKKSI